MRSFSVPKTEGQHARAFLRRHTSRKHCTKRAVLPIKLNWIQSRGLIDPFDTNQVGSAVHPKRNTCDHHDLVAHFGEFCRLAFLDCNAHHVVRVCRIASESGFHTPSKRQLILDPFAWRECRNHARGSVARNAPDGAASRGEANNRSRAERVRHVTRGKCNGILRRQSFARLRPGTCRWRILPKASRHPYRQKSRSPRRSLRHGLDEDSRACSRAFAWR
jgi:hypothetical protein